MDTSAKGTPKKGVFQYFTDALKKYAVFNGRARRKEYFCCTIISGIIVVVVSSIYNAIFGKGNIGSFGYVFDFSFGVTNVPSNIRNLISLGFFIPQLAVGWRRMHDYVKSELYFLIPFYNIFLAFRAGNIGGNKYGSDPKGD
jgi:uncharacterized membrane protein YhaH (DUF805 family)